MRDAIIGGIVGLAAGIVLGVAVLAPRLGAMTERHGLADGRGAIRAEAGLVPAGSGVAPAADAAIRWRMASAYSSSLPQLGTQAKRLEEQIWRVSAGAFEIRHHEPGALVAPEDAFDAVAAGAVDALFATPADWAAGDFSALQVFAAIPFGPAATEYLAWIGFGGGRRLMEDLYGRYNLHGVVCGVVAAAGSGWFRREFRLPEELRGLRMRATGLGARVLQRLGVKTSTLAGGDIYMALEQGMVDGVQFSMPAIDLRLGLQQMASHYYLPGWQQPSTLMHLIVNLDRWAALTPVHKAQLQTVCGDNVRHGLAEGESLQYAALRELQTKGVAIRRWPPPLLEAFRRAWEEVAREEAQADAEFRRAWTSLSAFRREYAIWKDLGYP